MTTTASYPVSSYTATTAPTSLQSHYMNRLGCGYSRGTYAQLKAAGSVTAWLDRQLTPSLIPESAVAAALPSWFPELAHAPTTKWSNNITKTRAGWEYARDLASISLLRRMYSQRQVLENMVGFWSDHLHVHADSDLAWVHRASYDEVLRTHALGTFENMLVATALHPAMLLFLDNWKSVRNAPNENHGRELLELHTVGRASGYTEQMVKDSAKILSGWTVDATKTWNGFYDPAKHTTGPVQVLGFTSENGSADAQQLARDYLRYLARHPATALNIARKLARHFVSDTPSVSLINAVATAYRNSGTDIKATLRALVTHPDFVASRGLLVRTPVEDFVATCRVLQVAVAKPTALESFARNCVYTPRTTLLYQWPRPDGAPLGAAAWASPGRMLTSFQMHWNLTAGYWPKLDVTYRTASSWLPQPQLRFDRYVDHLCRMLLGKGSDSRLLNAAVAGTGYGPATVVTKDHPVSSWMFVRLVAVLLDSPDHMRR